MIKILVIEDETELLDELVTWLEIEGYKVLGAENGKQGLEILYREHLDLVLCDINMPEMDGHAVLIALRSDERYSQLPFIFLTASADRDSMREGMNLGADDYITKPFTYAEIVSAVKIRLGKQEQFRSQLDHLTNLIDSEREQRLLKSRLVGMFSHDFRNPLATILSSSNMLQSYSDRLSPVQKQEKFDRIDGSVHLLIQMLDEMLMVAEIENDQLFYNPQQTDLNKIIHKIAENFQLIDGNKHRFTTSTDLPNLVMIDPKLIQHVVTNLVSNAIKYSPDGSDIRINAWIDHGEVNISVQDQGIGIPVDAISKVFEPFFRADNARRVKGTGLGLSLVKHAVDVCEGTISLTSELGHGTTFTVKIPSHTA